MKNRFLLTALVVALAAAATAFARPTVATPQDSDETQLEQYMEEINRGMRKLRRAVTDPEANAESIQDVRAMELLVIKSRNETPKMAADIAVEESRAQLMQTRVANEKMEADSRAYAVEQMVEKLRDVDWRKLMVMNQGADPQALIALAFQDLAGSAAKIGTLNVTPELLSSLRSSRDGRA